jgi:hypothetical protein
LISNVRGGVIAVAACLSVLLGSAHGEQVRNQCFVLKTACMGSCRDRKGYPDKDECTRKCQVDMDACKESFQLELKTTSWKKRCLSLPSEERYFVDVIALAWRRASAMLRAQSLQLDYVERRIREIGAEVNGPRTREISSLVSTLDVTNAEFLKFFTIVSDNDPQRAANDLYVEISSGQSAFDVLSDGASRLVVSALFQGANETSSLVNNAQALTSMAHDFDQAIGKHGDILSARAALLLSLTNLRSAISLLNSNFARIRGAQESQQPKQLLNEVLAAQNMCSLSH